MYTVTEQTFVRTNGVLHIFSKVVCYIPIVNKQTINELTAALSEIHDVCITDIINLCNGRYEVRTDDKNFMIVIEDTPTIKEMLEDYREFVEYNE